MGCSKYLFPTVCYNTVEGKSVHTSNLCNNQTGARFLTKHLKFKLGLMIAYSPANWSWRVHSYFTSLRVICKVITTLDMSTSNNNEISTQQNNLILLPSHQDYQSWNGSHTDIICFSKKNSCIGSMKDVIVSQLTHAYDHDLQTQQALNSKQTQKYA